VQVVKDCEHGIVCRVRLLDDAGAEVMPVTRFLRICATPTTARIRSAPTATIFGIW
jgi:hypothetical protein